MCSDRFIIPHHSINNIYDKLKPLPTRRPLWSSCDIASSPEPSDLRSTFARLHALGWIKLIFCFPSGGLCKINEGRRPVARAGPGINLSGCVLLDVCLSTRLSVYKRFAQWITWFDLTFEDHQLFPVFECADIIIKNRQWRMFRR